MLNSTEISAARRLGNTTVPSSARHLGCISGQHNIVTVLQEKDISEIDFL